MYSVIAPNDKVLLQGLSLAGARYLARLKPGRAVLGPCSVCSHEALDERPQDSYGALLCWHCMGRVMPVADVAEELASAEAYLDMLWARPMAVWADWQERNEAIRVATLRVATLKASNTL